MKKNTGLNKHLIIMLSFFCITAGIYSCKSRIETDPADKAQVNPAFELNPPIADKVSMELLEKEIDGNNVRVTAVFPKGTVKDQFHAMLVNGEKIVLRDDGKKGDENGGDGKFSILFKEDPGILKENFAALSVRVQEALKEHKSFIQFTGRNAIPVILDSSLIFSLKDGLRPSAIIDLGNLALVLPADPALKDHSLMLTDLTIVEDPTRTFNPCNGTGNPTGIWTFGNLVTELANQTLTGVTPEDFTKDWLDTWMNTVTVNGDNAAARTDIFTGIIKPWLQRSGATNPINTTNWKTKPLDVTQAPFKLSAIVNRIDLKGNSGYGFSNAGEGRFVFSVVSCNNGGGSTARRFNIIFEYGINKTACADVHAYAQEWADLRNFTIGSAAFNSALENITKQFILHGTNTAKPNQSSLNQLRTNEIQLGITDPVNFPWELREFNIDAATHKLKMVTVKQEPAEKYNRMTVTPDPAGTPATDFVAIAAWINANQTSIDNGAFEVPASFLGAKAHTENPGHFWDLNVPPASGSITGNLTRHLFSLNTCSGCHGGESDTRNGNFIGLSPVSGFTDFVHVEFVPFGQQAKLSGFLIGDPSDAAGLYRVSDPAGRGMPVDVRGFNDLERRARFITDFLASSCSIFPFPPFDLAFNLTHRPITLMQH